MLLASTGIAQILPAPPTGPEATFRVEVWGYISEDFSKRVQSYFDLRRKLQEGLPPLRVTEDVSEIRDVRRALAKRNPSGTSRSARGRYLLAGHQRSVQGGPYPGDERR